MTQVIFTSPMVLNCGCINMAELNKKLYIKKNGAQSETKLYTTVVEAGNAYAYGKVDGVAFFVPLGAENDSRATLGRVHESKGDNFAILTSGKTPYGKNEYYTPGTYTWTAPAGVTRVRVTVAGAGGGGLYQAIRLHSGYMVYKGGRGALITTYMDVNPLNNYVINVGAGGAEYRITNKNANVEEWHKYGADGGASSFASISAQGGEGYATGAGNQERYATSYGDGGLGGYWDASDQSNWWFYQINSHGGNGDNGWVIVEYGGDI